MTVVKKRKVKNTIPNDEDEVLSPAFPDAPEFARVMMSSETMT